MPERPIIFSASMIQALLEGRKTQTRRLAKRHVVRKMPGGFYQDFIDQPSPWLKVKPGDKLWVRESLYVWGRWRQDGVNARGLPRWRFVEVGQRASSDPPSDLIGTRSIRHIEKFWLRPAIHMPRWASRFTLTVTDVRVQRLGDLSADDAEAEGLWRGRVRRHLFWLNATACRLVEGRPHRAAFRDLWDSLHGEGAWDANPEVIALSFTVERRNAPVDANSP